MTGTAQSFVAGLCRFRVYICSLDKARYVWEKEKRMSKKLKKIVKRVKKECGMQKTLRAGYPRKLSAKWYNACRRDDRVWTKSFTRQERDKFHAQGYLAKTVKYLEFTPDPGERISDLDYMFLQPFNNSYSKWIADLNTMRRMFPAYAAYLPEVYYSIYNHDGLHIVTFPTANTATGVDDILATLAQKQSLTLRPSFFSSKGWSYELKLLNPDTVVVGDRIKTPEQFEQFLSNLSPVYVVCEPLRYNYPLTEDWDKSSFFKLYIANDTSRGSAILFGVADVFDKESDEQYELDCKEGTFKYEDQVIRVPHWDSISETVLKLAADIPQISYFTISVTVSASGFMITNCNESPVLPPIMINKELNDYLLGRVADKEKKPETVKQWMESYRSSREHRALIQRGKKGIRPYMQKLWESALESDKEWTGTTPEQKKWAWERGFFSWHIPQYGLTEENYKNYLSDYQYHWLNRINNVYQKWVNDKLTFRYIMEPYKQYVPEYYYSVYKNRGKTVISKLVDCPDGLDNSTDSVCALLRQKTKLAFKAAAGTHGDGFYALEYAAQTDTYLINGEEHSKEELEALIQSQQSFYVLTSYIEMHPAMKSIYPKAVNTIRIMVFNTEGHNPKIMQTYMRIGSSGSGYTDNVGYGGICVMLDMDTGVLYDAETIKDHVFYPCPVHPDTGVQIEGFRIPHWKQVCEGVLDICRAMPELEYLGFDVAVTEDSFIVLEINIHQDLHKAALFTEEIMDFYHRQIRYKERINGLPYSV